MGQGQQTNTNLKRQDAHPSQPEIVSFSASAKNLIKANITGGARSFANAQDDNLLPFRRKIKSYECARS